MRTVLQDLCYSLRQLVNNPGFTLTAVISLARQHELRSLESGGSQCSAYIF
jgi:hypothetical protein